MAQILLAIFAVLAVAEIAAEEGAEATDWTGKGECADGECRASSTDDGQDIRASAFVQKHVVVTQIEEHRQKQNQEEKEEEVQEEGSAADPNWVWLTPYDWVRVHMGHGHHQDTANSVTVLRKCRCWGDTCGPMPGEVISYRQSYPKSSHHSTYWDQWSFDWWKIHERDHDEPQTCFLNSCADGDTGCQGYPIFQIKTDGPDAAFIDYVEFSLYRRQDAWGSLRDFKWGKDGGGGWTLSTQSTDHFTRSVGTSACWEFDTWQMKSRRC